MYRCEVFIVGGGAAGMAAALAAAEKGCSVCIAEKDAAPGGVLRQCVHNGFGLGVLGRDVTGVEFGKHMTSLVEDAGIEVLTGTTVIELGEDRTALVSGEGIFGRVHFERCILATGCMERTIESLQVAGTRPSGVLTAGTAQAFINLGGHGVGDEIVILGSGDVGQIMARQFVQMGKKVICLIEKEPELGGLARNRRDCIEAYGIPVLLNTTVEEILGEGRINGVVARNMKTGLKQKIKCNTLVTAVGLLPDRSLCRGLTADDGRLPDWLRLCGNCDHVHDIVDSVVKHATAVGAETAAGLRP